MQQTMSNIVNACIDDINHSEFQSVVSVCESLVENYEKMYSILVHSDNDESPQYESFVESFISESDSIWRKTDKNGKKENILISILLLPVRLIKALIKLIRRSSLKSESQSLDKKLDEIEKLVEEDKVKTPRGTGKKKKKSKKTNKEEDIEVTIDTTSGGAEVSSNVDLEKANKIIKQAKEQTERDKEKIDELLKDNDLGKALSNSQRAGLISKRDAKKVVDLLTSVTVDGKKRTPVKQYKTIKKQSIDLLTETERVCDEYQRSLEKLISIIKHNPSENVEIDDAVIKDLTELHKESQDIVLSTAEGLAYLESCIKAANDAADMILGRSNGEEE